MRRATILVVDDHDAVRDSLQRTLGGEGYDVHVAASARAALEALPRCRPDLVLLDLRLPDMRGLGALEALRALDRDVPVIALSSPADQETAVRALQMGALAYIHKPVHLEHLDVLVQKALAASHGSREWAALRRRECEYFDRGFVRGGSPAMASVHDIAEQIARSTSAVILIEGEAGSGRTSLASFLHRMSPRHAGPFLEVNCAALPEDILDRELFGGGDAPGEAAHRPGLLEIAENGTVCIENIESLTPALQDKLARVLEKGALSRPGQRGDIELTARVVVTCLGDLAGAVARGQIQPTLQRRIRAVPLRVPPLRERGDDVLILADHFVADFSATFAKTFVGCAPEAQAALLEYPWPGNVRELRNLFERVILLEKDDVVRSGMLGLPTSASDTTTGDALARLTRVLKSPGFPDQGVPTEDLLNELERTLIERASDAAQGNQTRTAQLLGMKRDRLRYRMKQFGLQLTPQREREAA